MTIIMEAAPPGTVCRCSARHDPDPCGYLEHHHVLPLYLGGMRTGRREWLCATGHNIVHAVIRQLVTRPAGDPVPGRYTVLPGERPSRYLYDLALEANRLWEAAGRPQPRMLPEEDQT